MSYSLESSQDLPGAEESSPPPTYNRPTQLSISKGLIISNNVHDQYSPILSPSPVPSDTHLPSCDEVHLADSSEDSDESESGEESGHEAEEIVNVNHVNVVGREAEQGRAPISTSSESESQPIPVVVPPTAGGVGSDEVSAEDRPSHVSLLGGKYLLFANPNPNPAAPTQPAPACPVLSSNKNIQKCINVETREHFFCKVVPRSAAGLSLLATYHRLDDFSDCINKIHEIILGPKQIYLIFPLNYGNVHSYLLAKKRLREGEAAHLFRQMVKAVQFCHDKGIVLRDLKLGKFVFLDKERTIIKLESLEDAVLLSENSDDGLSDKHGCPNYVSPEKAEILRSNNKYPGKATDIWGLGVMLYTMLVGRYPFNDPDHSKLFNKIRRGAFTIPEQLSTNSKCLIRCLLRKEPTGRLSCPEIIMHPWLMDQRRGGTTLASAVEATREGMNRGFTGRGARPQILNQQQPLRAAGKPMDTDDQVVPVYNPPTSS